MLKTKKRTRYAEVGRGWGRKQMGNNFVKEKTLIVIILDKERKECKVKDVIKDIKRNK